MKFKKLSENIHCLAGPFFVFYLVEGRERTALIELGISQLVPQILHDAAEGLGGGKPDVLVAMHGHFDHAGSCWRWKNALPAAELCGTKRAADELSDPDAPAPYLRSMRSAGAAPFFKQLYPLAEDEPVMEPVQFDRILGEGDEIDLGGETLEVVMTPGHSACSMTLYHSSTKTWFVSDSCGMPLPSGRIWPTAFLDGKLYIESIRKIARREAEHICPGHLPPMSGADRNKRFLEKNIEASEKFFSRIAELWEQSGDRDFVLKTINDDFGKDAAPALTFIFKYGNKEMIRQVIDGVQGRG